MTHKRKMKFVVLFIIASILIFLAAGKLMVQYNNHRLKQALTTLDTQTVTLNEVVPFKWDVVYTFGPYLPKENMQEIIGFKSNDLKETMSEGMVQLVFVKGRSVVSSVCGYADVLGYSIQFEPREGDYYSKAEFKDYVIFDVKKHDDIVRLSYENTPAY